MNRLIKCVRVTTGLCFAGTIHVLGNPVEWTANGHWYDVVPASNISWFDANAAANTSIWMGVNGHLATVTSTLEDTFVLNLINSLNPAYSWGYYAGGYQDPGVIPSDAGWKWVTGEPWNYSNWAGGEPCDYYGPASEQALEVAWQKLYWNDAVVTGYIDGYVVEYENGSASVPDTGSTVIIFGLAVGSLARFRRTFWLDQEKLPDRRLLA